MERICIFPVYLFLFPGAFVPGFLVELVSRKNENSIYIIPIVIEIALPVFAAIFGNNLIERYANVIACILLFSIGLQNSLVTKISNSIVRTTHFTGLFTDLGIELAQLFFYKEINLKQKLYSSIKLRFIIISFFLTGGIVGGIFYAKLQLKVLFIAIFGFNFWINL